MSYLAQAYSKSPNIRRGDVINQRKARNYLERNYLALCK